MLSIKPGIAFQFVFNPVATARYLYLIGSPYETFTSFASGLNPIILSLIQVTPLGMTSFVFLLLFRTLNAPPPTRVQEGW